MVIGYWLLARTEPLKKSEPSGARQLFKQFSALKEQI